MKEGLGGKGLGGIDPKGNPIIRLPRGAKLNILFLFIGLGLGGIVYGQGKINDNLTQALSSTEGAMRGEESTQGIYTTTTSGSDDPLDMPGWMTGKKTESIRDDPDNTYIGTKATEDAINKWLRVNGQADRSIQFSKEGDSCTSKTEATFFHGGKSSGTIMLGEIEENIFGEQNTGGKVYSLGEVIDMVNGFIVTGR